MVQGNRARIANAILQRPEFWMSSGEGSNGLEMGNTAGMALGAVSRSDLSQVLRAGVLGMARTALWRKRLGGLVRWCLMTLQASLVGNLLAEPNNLQAFDLDRMTALAFFSDEGVRMRHWARRKGG